MNITIVQQQIPLQCIGGCGSGIGFFYVLFFVGSITVIELIILIVIQSFIDSGKEEETFKHYGNSYVDIDEVIQERNN